MPAAVKAQVEKLWATEIKDASGKPSRSSERRIRR
jgi:hypothetical protein